MIAVLRPKIGGAFGMVELPVRPGWDVRLVSTLNMKIAWRRARESMQEQQK
jgi:hypothetical protein